MEIHHEPVLLREVQEILTPKPGDTVLDATVGLGGHARMFLEAIGSTGKFIALDADVENLNLAKARVQDVPGRKEFHHCNFRELPNLNVPKVDVLFADLGLSSPHVDDPGRGFTFRADAPLDLRYDRSQGQTGAELIADSTVEHLHWILKDFGEVRRPRSFAAAIVKGKPATTGQLRACIEEVCGWRAKHVLPQIFQALRIAVNDELGALEVLLAHGPTMLNPNGRMGIISYHSLEDRMVKQAFRALAAPEKDLVTGQPMHAAAFELFTKKPVVPSAEDIQGNPRARSAKFRAIRIAGSG